MNIDLRCFLHNPGNFAIEGSPKSGLCPTLIERLQVFLRTAISRPLNSLGNCQVKESNVKVQVTGTE